MPDVPDSMQNMPSSVSTIRVCSFNIAFLGLYTRKDNEAVASVLAPCDIALIQELTAPPEDVVYPDGDSDAADAEARAFFSEMAALGFSYWLSEEDTGPGDSLHSAGSDTEWWTVFYRDDVVTPQFGSLAGFIDEPHAAHDVFARVPYAFRFEIVGMALPVMFLNVHLAAGADATVARADEFAFMFQWIAGAIPPDEAVFIVGDMNLSGAAELASVLSENWTSLNAQCEKTNTASSHECYDHVIFDTSKQTSVVVIGSFEVIDLVDEMRVFWDVSLGPYVGDPYVHDEFLQYYSDHRPISFEFSVERL